MEDYVDLNKKNTEYLINKTIKERGRIKKLIKNRYSIQYQMMSPYIDKDKSLLDIGIRDGAFLDYMRKQGFNNLYGVDIYERSVEMARANGIDAEVANAQHLSLDRRFDVAVMSHVLEHCPDPIGVLNNVYEHLNDGGILFIEVPIEQGPPKPTEKDAHYFNFHSFNDMLKILDKKWEVLDKFVSKNRIKLVARRIANE